MSDSILVTEKPNSGKIPFHKKKEIRGIIVPAAFVGYGIISLHSKVLKNFDQDGKRERFEKFPGFSTKVDNYLQYSPAVAVYALNLFGVKGKNNIRDITMIYALSTVISTTVVTASKNLIHVERPDFSSDNSFPSGHTATAFAAAEFLRQEYKEISPWYGIAGYAAATTTGVFRILNNKHWLSDVVTGAGVGIISTKLAYWIYPAIKRKFFKDRPHNTIVMPYYQSGGGGISLVYNFKR